MHDSRMHWQASNLSGLLRDTAQTAMGYNILQETLDSFPYAELYADGATETDSLTVKIDSLLRKKVVALSVRFHSGYHSCNR